jgi:hypothetical protein
LQSLSLQSETEAILPEVSADGGGAHEELRGRRRASPDFSPEVNNEQGLRVEKGRFFGHNCGVQNVVYVRREAAHALSSLKELKSRPPASSGKTGQNGMPAATG